MEIPKEWLIKMTTVEEAEIEHDVCGEPFGRMFSEWKEFKRYLQEEDELWEFSSPKINWDRRYGRAGICILRNGVSIREIVTSMS
jgi:hypothetical protein